MIEISENVKGRVWTTKSDKEKEREIVRIKKGRKTRQTSTQVVSKGDKRRQTVTKEGFDG